MASVGSAVGTIPRYPTRCGNVAIAIHVCLSVCLSVIATNVEEALILDIFDYRV